MRFKVSIARHSIQYFTVEAQSQEEAREIAQQEAYETWIRPDETDDEILKVEMQNEENKE